MVIKEWALVLLGSDRQSTKRTMEYERDKTG